jgi:uncharacterized protein YggE
MYRSILGCLAATALTALSTPAASTALSTPAASQIQAGSSLPADRPTIVVTGTGRAEQAPDTFVFKANIEGRGVDRLSALGELNANQSRIMASLPKLEGLTGARITTGDFGVSPVRAADCNTPYGRDESNCPITGYRATMPITMSGSPAERAGDAISLAAELGADGASLESYELSEMGALRETANRNAFADARRQAETLASASGQRLGRVLRVSDANARMYGDSAGLVSVEEVVVTGSRVRGSVPITVAPPPVTAQSNIAVVFEIE